MRTPARFLITLGVAALAASAQAGPFQNDQLRFDDQVDAGRASYDRASRLDRPAQKLAALDSAQASFRRARRISIGRDAPGYQKMEEEVEPLLVTALCDEAWIQVQRKSLSRAKAAVYEALAVDPGDSRALNLEARIVAMEQKDLYDDSLGQAAVTRIRERRAGAGIAARERGISLRR